jgi:hypothetical protein
MAVRALVLCSLVACTPKQPPRQELPPVVPIGAGSAKPTPTPTPAAATSLRYTVLGAQGTKKTGYYQKTTKPNGDVSTVLHVVDNGRGPHVEATWRLAADGTFRAYSATGKHTMGTKVAETFTRSGDRVTWKSEEESADRTVSGAAFFLPMADGPTSDLLVPAIQKAGGKLALLPGGEARLETIGTLDVTVGSLSRKLTGYAIRGIGFDPIYTWFDDAGVWFGECTSWQSIVREGWESVSQQLVERQLAITKAADAQLAQVARHVPPAAGLVLTHARVLDIDKGSWLADQTIVIVGDTIKAIGPKPPLPAGAETIDLGGKSVIPGLIDMHSHTDATSGLLGIASGVTTIRDVGNNPDLLDGLKQRFDTGAAVGPQLVRYGFIEGRGDKAASSMVTAETPDEAKAAVEYYAKRGYEGIKIYNSVKTELVPLLAKEAHAKNLLVIGHVPIHMLANEAVKAGYDGIEHINQVMLNFFATHDTDTRDTTRFTLVGEKMPAFDLDGKPMRELIDLFKKNKTVVDPTLVAFQDLIAGVPGKITPGLETVVERLPSQVQRGFLTGGLPLDGDRRDLYAKAWTKLLAAVKTLHKAKVHLVAGTDHIGGVMLHEELRLFVKAGLSPLEALRTATSEAARGMRMQTRFGSIAVGKRADLAILTGDPIADITKLRTIERTVRAGVVYTSAPLFEAAGVKP